LLRLLTEGVSVVTNNLERSRQHRKLVTAVRKVLAGFAHEIIVLMTVSTDGTIEIAQRQLMWRSQSSAKDKAKVYFTACNWRNTPSW
jgi:hypothetical protein